jgi:ATP dependent DNA ligase domain
MWLIWPRVIPRPWTDRQRSVAPRRSRAGALFRVGVGAGRAGNRFPSAALPCARSRSVKLDSHFRRLAHIFSFMQFQPAIPTRGTKVPATPEWIHEIKYDGFRLIVHRDGDRVRLLTRNDHNWADRSGS